MRCLRILSIAAVAWGVSGCRTSLDRPSDGHARDAPSPDLGLPRTAEARRAFFTGLGDMEGPLARLRASPTPAGVKPKLERLPDVEAAVMRRYPLGTSAGRLRDLMVVGVCARSRMPPRQLARLLENGLVQKRALDADRVTELVTTLDTNDALRRVYRVELLRVGEGPVMVDLRFTTAIEKWAFADGSVLLRYDPQPVPPPEHVTLFRGACAIEPEGTGSLYTEVMIVGTDISVPFFLKGTLRDKSINLFRTRAERIWGLANRP